MGEESASGLCLERLKASPEDWCVTPAAPRPFPSLSGTPCSARKTQPQPSASVSRPAQWTCLLLGSSWASCWSAGVFLHCCRLNQADRGKGRGASQVGTRALLCCLPVPSMPLASWGFLRICDRADVQRLPGREQGLRETAVLSVSLSLSQRSAAERRGLCASCTRRIRAPRDATPPLRGFASLAFVLRVQPPSSFQARPCTVVGATAEEAGV